MSEEALFCSC